MYISIIIRNNSDKYILTIFYLTFDNKKNGYTVSTLSFEIKKSYFSRAPG